LLTGGEERAAAWVAGERGHPGQGQRGTPEPPKPWAKSPMGQLDVQPITPGRRGESSITMAAARAGQRGLGDILRRHGPPRREASLVPRCPAGGPRAAGGVPSTPQHRAGPRLASPICFLPLGERRRRNGISRGARRTPICADNYQAHNNIYPEPGVSERLPEPVRRRPLASPRYRRGAGAEWLTKPLVSRPRVGTGGLRGGCGAPAEVGWRGRDFASRSLGCSSGEQKNNIL